MVNSALRFYLPVDLRHGMGVARMLPEVLSSMSVRRVLIVTDQGVRNAGILEPLVESLAGFETAVLDQVPSNPTAQNVSELLDKARALAPEGVVSIGGGSPLDVAKVLCLLLSNPGTLEEYQWGGRPVERPVLPLVVLPTTAGTGAEVSRAAVIVDRGQKQGIARDALYPRVALVDPELTRTVPPALTAATGLDAFAHAVEALVAKGANPITEAWALTAARLIFTYLPIAYRNGHDMEARSQLSLAATMAGVAMGQAGLGIIHAIASPLGGRFNIHHGLTNALLLPEALRFNAPVAAEPYARLAYVLGIAREGMEAEAASQALADGIQQFIADLGIEFDLSRHGVTEADVASLAADSANNWMARSNPRPVRPEDCERILRALLR